MRFRYVLCLLHSHCHINKYEKYISRLILGNVIFRNSRTFQDKQSISRAFQYCTNPDCREIHVQYILDRRDGLLLILSYMYMYAMWFDLIFRPHWFMGKKAYEPMSEQSKICRSCSENIPKVCLFYGQNNKIAWFGRHTVWEIHEAHKGLGIFFFLDCAFQTLIGWAGNLQ